MSTRSLESVFTYRGRDVSIYKLGTWFTIALSVVIFGFPIYWMFASSVKPVEAITNFPPQFVPLEVTFTAWNRLFFETQYLTWLKNSIIVSVGDVVLSTTLATLAGYSLTRYRIPAKRWIARSFIFGYMFPPLLLGVPYYLLFQKFGMLNTLPAVIIAHTAIILPFSTWVMWQFFQTVPISLEEASWVYGASRLRGMFEVALPSAVPGIVASAIFAFTIGWSDFTISLLLLSTPDKQVLTLGIQGFMTALQIYWGNLMAASAGLVIPPLIVVLLLNRYILAGFTVRSE